MSRTGPSLVDVVREGTLDAELAALLWLLVEGGVPLTVTGPAPDDTRGRLARTLLELPPEAPGVLVDAQRTRPELATLGARMRTGMRLAITLPAADLRDVMARLSAPPDGLPDDAVRRLGMVLVMDEVSGIGTGPVRPRPRVLAAHYLRPTERDAQGHVQRRPPAVLATWRPEDDTFDHFAWGLIPELADLVDRSQVSFEVLQSSRAAELRRLTALATTHRATQDAALVRVLAGEPAREPAPPRPAASTSHVPNPLTDPHIH